MNTRQQHEGYRVSIRPAEETLRVEVAGIPIAESSRAMIMFETRLPPVIYFPREDVAMDRLQSNPTTTHCPFKGNASYFDLKDQNTDKICWSYEQGFDEAALVRDFVAFDQSKIDGIFVGKEPYQIAQRPKLPENPLVPWLLQEAWQSSSIADTLEALATKLRNEGVRLSRLRLFVRTLNPQLYGKFYTWRLNEAEIEESQATHKGMLSEAHLSSPYARIIDGEGGIRRKLEGDDPVLDFPVLHELLEQGATDYVAVPMNFSDGQINILSLVSNEAGGFTTTELGYLYEVLPHLGRLIEAHAQRDSALTLLQTYLGRNAGQRVLSGNVKRGDGQEIDAIIWFSDLRDSTRMADSMDRVTYLEGLDKYFDCVAGAIVASGGEVLKFIGDAILAIFPVDNGLEQACGQTINALRLAQEGLDRVNEERDREKLPHLRFGTGLHRGKILYGNIGAEARLDFTVIGPPVNEASRIEGLCKKLGEKVLTSRAFADGVQKGKRSLGEHELAGVKNSWELFGLDL